MSESINEAEGKALFGGDPNNYDTIRPPYPDKVYDFLQATGALRHTVATLELGAGNGLATRKLLELGAEPLTVLEPDAGFSRLLTSLASPDSGRFQVIQTSFEDAVLPSQHYDLVAAATSFHWFRPSVRVVKAADVLKPGGYLALWWNVFGDPEREDLFHEATVRVLETLPRSPSDPKDAIPFALDTAARRSEIVSIGAFDEPSCEMYRWELWLSTQQVGALYATFSSISRLPAYQRSTILEQLMDIAEREFGGRVARNMVTPVYVARRRSTHSS
jgi:SAM-dependent methyltransferase